MDQSPHKRTYLDSDAGKTDQPDTALTVGIREDDKRKAGMKK